MLECLTSDVPSQRRRRQRAEGNPKVRFAVSGSPHTRPVTRNYLDEVEKTLPYVSEGPGALGPALGAACEIAPFRPEDRLTFRS